MPLPDDVPADPLDVIATASLLLRQLIVAHMPPALGIREQDVQFASPADPAGDNQKTILVYLYNLTECSALKNAPPLIRAPDPRAAHADPLVSIERPALALDLDYMIVPVARDHLMELQLLGSLKRLFYRIGVVRSANLKPGPVRDHLLATGNDEIRLSARSLNLEVLNRTWGLFQAQHRYRTALYYLITPVWMPSGIEDRVPLVQRATAEQVSR